MAETTTGDGNGQSETIYRDSIAPKCGGFEECPKLGHILMAQLGKLMPSEQTYEINFIGNGEILGKLFYLNRTKIIINNGETEILQQEDISKYTAAKFDDLIGTFNALPLRRLRTNLDLFCKVLLRGNKTQETASDRVGPKIVRKILTRF